MADDNKFAQEERRVHHAAREVFARACVLLAPLVKSNDKAMNMSGFAMLHMVQSHFPGLSGLEAQVVITAVECLHRENRLQALLEKQASSPKT